MTQVQTTLLALAGMVSPVQSYHFTGEQPNLDISDCNYRFLLCLQAKTKGIHSSVDIGVKYAERQERAFDDEKMKAGQCVIGLQVRVIILKSLCHNFLLLCHVGFQIYDSSSNMSLTLQMGTNKCASQAGMNAYGTRRHLYDPKSHILPPMDHSTISLQMGTNKGASQVSITLLLS